MFSVHLFIILSGLILISSTLDQFKNNPCAEKCPPKCPPGWRMWRGSCYRFTPKASWSKAKASCKATGGAMAAPHSQEENDFFLGFARSDNANVPGGVIWIACDDQQKEGQWFCDGEMEINAFRNWFSGEPNQFQGTDEDCASLGILSEGKWFDGPCDGQFLALCRRAPEPSRMYCFTVNKEGRLNESCFEA